jgi:flagellar motor switch protein FliN
MQEQNQTPIQQLDTANGSVRNGQGVFDASSLSRVMNVELDLRVELGRVSLPIRDIIGLSSGMIIDLKKLVGEPMDVFVNDRPLAKGEVIVVDDEVLGVRITEVLDPEERAAGLQ